MIGELLLVVGAAFIFLAAIGVLRFSDVFVRMQLLSKASTFGLLTVLVGGVVSLESANDVTFLLLVGALHLVTSPVGSNLLARATYYAPDIDHGIDAVDELAELSSGSHPTQHGARENDPSDLPDGP
jgi:multicomponent Na+:H+ antiporter subunit G